MQVYKYGKKERRKGERGREREEKRERRKSEDRVLSCLTEPQNFRAGKEAFQVLPPNRLPIQNRNESMRLGPF